MKALVFYHERITQQGFGFIFCTMCTTKSIFEFGPGPGAVVTTTRSPAAGTHSRGEKH